MRNLPYLIALIALNALLAVAPWGSVYLSLIVAITYVVFLPNRVLHPNNMLFAFYGLYVILSSSLNLLLHVLEWEYVLPWGQQIFWDEISKYVLFQAEFTFLVLFFGFHFFSLDKRPATISTQANVEVADSYILVMYVLTAALVVHFIEVTGGFSAWIEEYSFTYLTKREGHGLLNVAIVAFGNITVFLLGLRFQQRKDKALMDKARTAFAALLIICALSYVNGVKSRFIFLLIMFAAPYLTTMAFRLKHVAWFGLSFFVLLYLGTLIRTEGFYSSAPYFLEMLVGYFNSFQLHDYVVTTRDPALFSTVLQVFVKPMQILGVIGPDIDFDISVMLTKEFFPEQWENEKATQQWPLDTELYLNYYGFFLSWIPLLFYALFVSWLYRTAVLRRNFALLPIFIMEFQRIFSTMRGTLIPWDIFIYVGQYLLIFAVCRAAISAGARKSGRPRIPRSVGGLPTVPSGPSR